MVCGTRGYTRKMVPITGQASSFLEFFLFLKTPISIQIKSKSNPNQVQIKSNPFFVLLSSFVSRANLSCVVAASFSSLVLLSSSVSTANLSCLRTTTFSSLSFLSNSFSSPRFNLLRVARRCFSWSSVSDDLFFSSCSFFWVSFLLYLFRVLSSAILSSVLQYLKLCLL